MEVVAEAGDGEARVAELLTERELEVLRLASKGMINNEMAEGLCFSVRTVQAHLGNIFNARYVGLIFGIRGEAT